ncbi:coiled-coil domain-containing protein 18 [Rhinophrynus dorsalis]
MPAKVSCVPPIQDNTSGYPRAYTKKDIKQMESHESTYPSQCEDLLTSVDFLRSKLRQAEQRLMSVEDSLSRFSPLAHSDSSSEHSLSREPLGLTLKDLEQPSHSKLKENMQSKGSMAYSGESSLRRTREKTFTSQVSSSIDAEQENKKLREKLKSLRDLNSSLVSQNRSLMNKIDSVEAELTKSKSRVRYFESALGARTSRIPEIEERLVSLEAKAEAKEKALRNAEDQLEQGEHALAEKEQVLQKFRDELKKLKIELYESCRLCKRAEKQRNEALLHAEELTKAFQQYKKNVTEKIEKAYAAEEKFNNKLTECEKERDDLQENCKILETQLENTKEHLRNVMSEKNSSEKRQQGVETKNTELISLLTQSNQRILRLENELENKEKVLKENIGLLHENKQLKERLAQRAEQSGMNSPQAELSTLKAESQEQCDSAVLDSKRDSEQPLEQINDSSSDAIRLLIADLRAKLSTKETENQELEARLMNRNNYNNVIQENDSLQALSVKLTSHCNEDDKYQQLELVCRQIQTDKERLSERVKELQGKLSKAQTEATNTKLSMEQRTSQFQVIQQELLGKLSKTSHLQNEMTKKCLKISALQKLIEEKTQAHSAAEARNVELEQEIVKYKDQIIHLEENISKEHDEVILAFEKSKNIHLDQHKELMKQIEHLQCQLEIKNLQITEQDHAITVLQQDTVSKQRQLESQNHLLTETRRELSLQTKNTGDAMRCLENQMEAETIKVRQLESALQLCKEELELYLHQLEDNRESFENQIKKKSEEVQCLQKEVKLRTLSLQETSEENVRLQQTLQQQQQMLQQGTVRIGDLEDSQAELQRQVSKLEHEIEKQRSTSEEELRRTEGKLHAANQELELKTQQVVELSSTLNQMRLELDLSNKKLLQVEEELISWRCDGQEQTNRLSQLQAVLQKTQVELDKKADIMSVLEEKLHSTEQNIKQKEEMEAELKTLREKLQSSTNQIEELEETLTKTHLSLEEKQVIIQRLTEELRTCKSELEDRDHELLDMDQALKDRNWELKQRAAQLTQLDMSIREHKGEMEQKIIKLESTLEKSELENRDYVKQITSIDEKLQHTRDQLCEKDFQLLQKDQVISQLKSSIERNQQTIADMEKTMKVQEQCISEQRRDSIDLSQQIKAAHERMQITYQELTETRQQLAEAQKESDRLTHKLEGMDRLSREKLQHMKEELEDAQDTISNLKTELQARNEVIKATNEVLILKESELTRMKARISGYERTMGLKQKQNAAIPPPALSSDYNPLESYKLSETSDSKYWKMHHSVNASDLGLTDISSLDLPKSIIGDLKDMELPDSATIKDSSRLSPRVSSDSLNETSFNPLTYSVDENCDTASDCEDLGTLSGMLKYIKKEMRKSENVHKLSPSKNVWTED